jgi:cyclopropane-fatty-acyl-phospholipid synthase
VPREAGASAAAIQAHYDEGDAFFVSFLDPTMTYSCAMFADEDADLAVAQTAKLDWHLDQARVREDVRLLDIGCGWGALLQRAHARGAIPHGLTLSAAQYAHVRAADCGARVALQSWAEHSGVYDALVSIGAFEHFAQPGLTREARVALYRTFFARAASWLPPGGRLSLQTMAYPEWFVRAHYDASSFGAFVRERIFPESDLPTLSEIVEASAPAFALVLLRDDRLDYAATLRAWLRNLREHGADQRHAARAKELAHYFTISKGAFELGALRLLRLVLEKPRRRA